MSRNSGKCASEWVILTLQSACVAGYFNDPKDDRHLLVHKEWSMKNTKWLMAAMSLVVLYFFAGCTTTVPVTYTEPARLDMSGINRVAIDSNDSGVTESISQKLAATGKYTVASAAELSEWKQWKRDQQALQELAAYQAQAIEVSSADLVSAYSGNAARADSSYLDKALKITAVVKEIGQSSGGNYFVRLEGAGNDSVDVFFNPSQLSGLAAVDKDQAVTIIGNCRGYNLPDMADTAEILRILGAGRSVNIVNATFPVEGLKAYPGPVDAVIALETSSSVQDDSHIDQRPRTDSRGNTLRDANGRVLYQNVTMYDRNVTVNVSYEVLRARDSSIIGQGTKSATSPNSSNEDPSLLPAPADLVARTINGPLDEFTGEIVPTQRSLSITLAKESENKEAKKEMSAAEKLAKAKNYADAAAAYGVIYARYKNFAAGYNQAVLTEVAAGTEVAVELMEALFRETGNPEAELTLAGMQSRNASNQRAAAQLAQ
jgi:hypothetical protein